MTVAHFEDPAVRNFIFVCKFSNTHTHKPFFAPSPLINTVTVLCVFLCKTKKVDWPCLACALLTDRWTMASCKEPHHTGLEDFGEISNYVAEECVCLGVCMCTHALIFVMPHT